MSFMSFSPRALWRMRNFPGRKVQLVEHRFKFIPKFHADVVGPDFQILDKRWVDLCKRRGQELYVWTVNEPEVALQLVEWGVETLITDNPELISKTVKSL